MSRVSIVGVDGSGKTVLMAALGERYETPDEYGFFLSAETPQTFHTVKMLMDRMRHGMWPNATTTDTVTSLDWTLYRKSGSQNVSVSELSFLDYAGEIYRLGFGEHSEAEKKVYASQIEALQNHMRNSDVLIVLINLKDIISGNLADPKTREMMWITKSILDFALKTANVSNVALAFSQYEVYRDAIEDAGGLEGAYRKYLRHVENMYPDLKLFAVSAVDKTEVDDAGYEIPARDFSSQGLDTLLEWVVSKIPGHENDISDIKEMPARLWTSLKSEIGLFLNDSGGTLASRLGHARNAAETLAKFESIGSKMRDKVADAEEIGRVRGEIDGFKSRAERALSVVSELLESTEEKTAGELRAWLSAHGVAEELIEGLVAEVEDVYQDRRNQREKARSRRRGFLVAASLVLLAGAGAVGWNWWEACQRRAAAELARKERIGYTSCVVDGKRTAKWVEGRVVPANAQLRTAAREGTYVAVRPGYVWVPGTVDDRWTPGSRWNPASDDILAGKEEGTWRSNRAGYRVSETGSQKKLEWVPGLAHPNNPILQADEKKDVWTCVKAGYRWDGGDRTSWCVGSRHPSDERLVAAESPGEWKAQVPGYVWDGADKAAWKPGLPHPDHVGIFAGEKTGTWVTDKPGYGVDSEFNAVWRPGLRHPNNKRLVSDVSEGRWTTTEPGYEWAGGSRTRWNVGVQNPFNSYLKASETEGEWISTRPGYRWAGGSRTEWKEGLAHPENSNLVSTGTEGQWRSIRLGYAWDGGTGEKWNVGTAHPKYPHVVASRTENDWRAAPGYVWTAPDDKDSFEVKWNSGVVVDGRKASSMEGKWLQQVDCSICDGTGRKSGRVDCSYCDGRGRVSGRVSCTNCGGGGRVNGSATCPNCSGSRFVRGKCTNPMHSMVCPNCRGSGLVNYGFYTGPCACRTLRCFQCNNTGYAMQICNRCSGVGQVQATVDCSSCGGSGKVSGMVTCGVCNGHRQVSGKVSCTYCGRDGCANGKVWERE